MHPNQFQNKQRWDLRKLEPNWTPVLHFSVPMNRSTINHFGNKVGAFRGACPNKQLLKLHVGVKFLIQPSYQDKLRLKGSPFSIWLLNHPGVSFYHSWLTDTRGLIESIRGSFSAPHRHSHRPPPPPMTSGKAIRPWHKTK